MKSSQIDAVHCSSPEDSGAVLVIDQENPLLTIETKFKNHSTLGSNFLNCFCTSKVRSREQEQQSHSVLS